VERQIEKSERAGTKWVSCEMLLKDKLILSNIALALLLVLSWAYGPSFDNPFAFDDQHAILDNGYIRSLTNFKKFFTDVSTISVLPTNHVYRPLAVLSLAIDYRLAGGLDPVQFHRSMYIVFLLQLAALFILVRNILFKSKLVQDKTRNAYAALLFTSLYAFNTTLAETLNYVCSRSDSYSTFFVVLAMMLYTNEGVSRKYYLYLIPIFLAGLTKETGVTVPFLIFSYEFFFSDKLTLRSRFKQAFIRFIPALITIVLFLALYIYMSTNPPKTGGSPVKYFATQLYVTIHYLLMFLAPVHLSADSDMKIFDDIFDERVLLSAIVHGLLLTGVVTGYFKKTFSPFAFGIVWYYFALAPTSSVFPIDDVQNDHRMFYPHVGLAIALATVVLLAIRQIEYQLGRRIASLILVVSFITYTAGHVYGIRARNEVWGDNESLWHDVVVKSPKNARGLMNYGIALMARADYANAKYYFDEAAKIWPTYSYIHINLGVLYSAQNLPVDAEREFRIANQLNPTNPTGHLFFANWLNKQGRYKESLNEVTIALNFSPDYLAAHELRLSLEQRLFGGSISSEEIKKLTSDFNLARYDKVLQDSVKFMNDPALKNAALELNAKSLWKLKRYDEAEIILESLKSEVPNIEFELEALRNDRAQNK